MSKRANGEGSIFRRADGRWCGSVSYTDERGEKRRRDVYGRTQAEARAKLRAVRERVDQGAPARDSSIMLEAFVPHWIATALTASDRKASTKENYAGIARTHLAVGPLRGSRLDRLRPSDVEALVMAKRAAGLSDSTVRTIYTVLRALLDSAVRDGLLARNPAAAVKRPTVERKEARALTRPQLLAVLGAASGDRLEALWMLMAGTGLRRGEALALNWRDVDLDAGRLQVRRTLTRLSTGLVFTEPKTERSRRTVALPRQVVAHLRAHRVRQVAEQLAAGSAWTGSGLVFTSEVGTPLEPRNVLRRFIAIAASAGVEGIGLHTLRHTTATRLLELGEDTRIVSEMLGHSSTAITADIYQHVEDQMRHAAASKLEAVLGD